MSVSVRRPVVLIAEDDTIARRIAAAELAQAGYQVIAYADGFSALEYLAMGERADALVTDVHMPGSFDGLFLAIEARSQRPHLPVVYVSGRSVDQAHMVDGARFLEKPYRIGALVGALSTAIETVQPDATVALAR